MSKRHGTYDKIKRLLSDGHWHPAQELDTITDHTDAWLVELGYDPAVDVKRDTEGTIRLRLAESGS